MLTLSDLDRGICQKDAFSDDEDELGFGTSLARRNCSIKVKIQSWTAELKSDDFRKLGRGKSWKSKI